MKIDLKRVGVASPCGMSWTAMKGDDRVRHCGDCKMNVYNVAELSSAEAGELIARHQSGERVCVRLQRRADGTLITKDCPVGRRQAKRRRFRISTAVASIFALVFGFFAQQSRAREIMGKIQIQPPKERPQATKPPPPPKPPVVSKPPPEALMGDIVVEPSESTGEE